MAIIQCVLGHYYDNIKHSECPHCKKMAAPGATPAVETPTISKITPNPLRNFVEPDEMKTIGVYRQKNVNPISGWLVCVDGENKGRSFEVHLGKNFVGRAMNMDINVNDASISRDTHFTIIYEPNESQFFLQPGNGITYFNGSILSVACELKEDDRIKAGKSEYVFVPYCKEGRGWDE